MIRIAEIWITGGTRRVSKLTEWVEGLSLSTGGRKLVGKAGILPVRRLADKVGLD
jgi:hypothetical protein